MTRKEDTAGAASGRDGRYSAPPAIELRHLRYFLAVFEELHFGRAAKRLRIAQPPLSQAIRKIESELGVQLFERTSRTVSATDAGVILATEARKVLSAFDTAVSEARRAGGAASPLRIGCVPHLPIQPLLRFLGALHDQDPNLRVQVTHLNFIEQARGLGAGELDLGIFHEARDHPDIESEPLFVGELLAAFLPPGHRLADRTVLRPDDLRSETLVVFPQEASPALHEGLLTRIAKAGYQFEDVRDAGGMNPRDVMLSVAEGLGVALGPVSLQEVSDVGSIVLRRPLEPPLSMPDMVVAWRADPPGRVKEKLPLVRRVARELYAGDGRD
ncbi:MAG TPA: LysR substrate-binding domain-containing protein [Gaiellaceae bacterium]|jgi:DNA-binding transcriptional LysR family regulator|nr:LysR substrate-binding domain-containing protein [Gaiellaceae bacterium]